MAANRAIFQMTPDDLGSHTLDDIKCIQCSAATCGFHVGVLHEGKPLIMCANKPATKDVMASMSKRARLLI